MGHEWSGLVDDPEQRIMWLQRAATQGHADGQYYLGRRYCYGRGVAQSAAEAVRWFVEAGKQGHEWGARHAATICFNELDDSRLGGYWQWRGRANGVILRLRHQKAALSVNHDSVLCELYQYGCGAFLDPSTKEELINSRYNDVGPTVLDESVRVYHQSSSRARSAALCWMWMRRVPKDVAKIVGREIWASRDDPAVWGVKLDREKSE